jgi:cytochrome d ubiquinol oxidase subunit II
LLGRSAGACLIGGIGFLTVAEAAWAHAIGVASLFAFIVLGFYVTVSSELARNGTE